MGRGGRQAGRGVQASEAEPRGEAGESQRVPRHLGALSFGARSVLSLEERQWGVCDDQRMESAAQSS